MQFTLINLLYKKGMKNMKFRKIAAITTAITAAASLCACTDNTTDTGTSDIVTTTAETVAINTEVLSDEDQAAVDEVAASKLVDTELENKTIKWLAHYDINPTTTGNSKSVQLELFESKYGGKVEYYATTWNTRYTDLSTYVLGGEGIDFFPNDTEALPKGVINGMFQPVDDYIDLDSELWAENADAMEIFNFGGKHYAFCTAVHPAAVVYYNKQTIEENGFTDPWELYENGEWNWDTFKNMLLEFVDPDAERYGLDGWYYQNALTLSGGMPAVTSENGALKLNLYEPALERTMNFAEELYKNGLCMDLSLFDWSEQPQFMGEGKELFYLAGAWHTYSDPSIWATKVSPENMGIVPVPCDPDGEPSYGITVDGFVLCKGAQNPEGVARYVECGIVAGLEEATDEIGREKTKNDYGWTDEMLDHYDECLRLAKEYPAYDLGSGVSSDFNTIVNTYAIYEPFRGGSYASLREETADAAQLLLDEANESLAAQNQ